MVRVSILDLNLETKPWDTKIQQLFKIEWVGVSKKSKGYNHNKMLQLQATPDGVGLKELII